MSIEEPHQTLLNLNLFQELHAHLNGSLSPKTLLELKRLHADSKISDMSNVFVDDFHIGAGDSRNLSDCFQIFSIAHALTSTPSALALATSLTLQEFQDDGCCYIELRSTPRETPYMTKRKYIETIVDSLQKASRHMSIISKYIVSIDRKLSTKIADEITDLAIEFHKKHPDVVVGIELSGDPTVACFTNFIPCFKRARESNMKISLHCGEVRNEQEVLQMLEFRPERIGHGTCIHPRHGGSDAAWNLLCTYKIPVEMCLTSNVKSKSTSNYESHHFKDLYDANIPLVLCTDDKGVFSTSLSAEYSVCGASSGLPPACLARLALTAASFVFHEGARKTIHDKILNFIDKKAL